MKRHPSDNPAGAARRLFPAAAAGTAAWLLPLPARADLLSGGLLGSVLRGDEFTGPRVLDLVVLGLGIFLVLRLILGRQRPGKSGDAGPSGPSDREPTPHDRDDDPGRPQEPRPKPDMYTNAAAMWSYLQSKPAGEAAPGPGSAAPPAAPGSDAEFLAGAKLAYPRIRFSMAKRDFDDLAGFVTPAFLDELRRRLTGSPPPEPDILLVEARIAEKRQENGHTIMVVDYEALIHEMNAPHNIDRFERWTFDRDDATPGANWLLAAMERGK
ncbi:hypothetical protein [Solidesulfovibrio sp.]|uniref:hypothetical protein n=1 Tax=Solidesulfovibrio sp. TaxID=2910990 RepID=UPI00261283D2|nr:hypothetical protein [Solidesulfovibrio sp.]